LDGGSGDDVLDGGEGADVLNGGTGTDTADYKESDSAVTIRLSATSSGGDAQGDTYSSVENANGSDYSDNFHGTSAANAFTGNGGDDTFHGDGGADFYDGGEGADTVNYSASEDRVFVDLIDGEGHFGDANLDTYESIENIVGSRASFNSLEGTDESNHIVSLGLEDDYVAGRGGIDTIEMRGRSTTIDAGAGDDIIEVWDVQDLASWQAYVPSNASWERADIDGGEGVDTLNFGSETNWVNLGNGNLLADELGVEVSLYSGGLPGEGQYKFDGMHFSGAVNSDGVSTGIAHSTWGDIKNIENVIGTQYNDVIGGNSQSNILKGEGGDDYLGGGAGADILDGGAGKDQLHGGADNDTLIGGVGADELNGGDDIDTAVYEDSDAGVIVTLLAGAGPAVGGHAEGDTLEEIENVIGSDYDDFLVGSVGDNVLEGGGGNDVIDGSSGNDVLIGGEGADEFLFGAQFGFSENWSTIADFEIGSDKINLSHLSGIDSWEDIEPLLSETRPDGTYYGYQQPDPSDGPLEIHHMYLVHEEAVIEISSGWVPVGTSFEMTSYDFIF
jgi:Ca2+-binding RTX toxin-like protein